MIEVKAIGLELRENHLRQVVDYCANNGVQWAVLSNGIQWEIYKVKFEQPISSDKVCAFNFLELNTRSEEDRDKLFILCKEGLQKNAREEFYEKIQTLNRFVVGNLLLTESVLATMRREIKRFSPGIKVEHEDIEKLLINDIIKREVLEGDDAVKTQSKIRRFYSKLKKAKDDSSASMVEPTVNADTISQTPQELTTPTPDGTATPV